MLNIRREFANVRHMKFLACCAILRDVLHGICYWLVVGQYAEDTSFKEVSKVADGQVVGQKFAVKRTVARLCRLQFLGEVGQRSPFTNNQTVPDRYPIPNIQDFTMNLHDKTIFSIKQLNHTKLLPLIYHNRVGQSSLRHCGLGVRLDSPQTREGTFRRCGRGRLALYRLH